MDSEDARRVAGAWVDAWRSGDPERVLALLHESAVLVDPADEVHGGKVRPPDVAAHVRARMAAGAPPVHSWTALAGVDSIAVTCTRADGTRQSDTLVLTDDGRIVRAMRHS
ncbi:MAG: nuclear transport factor 2 family protein [Acidimicrobiales bacterium]